MGSRHGNRCRELAPAARSCSIRARVSRQRCRRRCPTSPDGRGPDRHRRDLGRPSPQAPFRHRRARRRAAGPDSDTGIYAAFLTGASPGRAPAADRDVCDLVGSTALSTGMDPEDLRDVIASFQSRCNAAIRRYDGFVAKYMGDGILVYFGYPRAHEDEAERSVRAGLDIVDAMAELNAAVP